MCSIPSVFQNFSSSYTVTNPLPSNPGNWDFDLFFFAHPYLIGALKTTDAVGTVAWSALLNPHIPGTTYADKRDYVYAEWEKYRISYLGITGYHDAAALTNNGLLAVAQYPQAPECATYIDDSESSVHYFALIRRAELWPQTAKTFAQLQNMPNAFFGTAKEGMYAPYKLSETCQDWVSAKDLVLHFGYTTSSAFLPTDGSQPVGAPGTNEGPYGLVGSNSSGTYCIHRRSDDGIIHISGKQFASAAAFTTYYRSGWEIQVTPGSTLTSFAKTSPICDQIALTSYFTISRELKDAYPADYNDLGKIVRTIADAAATILPTIFPAASVPIGIARKLVDKVFPEKSGNGKPRVNNMSAAQAERLKSEVSTKQPVQQNAKRGDNNSRRKLNIRRVK